MLTGNYGPMLPYLVQMNIDQLVLECATPRAGEMEVFKEYSNEKEIGLGVVNPRTDEIEPPEQIVTRVKELLQYFDPDKIYLNPDCGFGTFAERKREHTCSRHREDEDHHRGGAHPEGRVRLIPSTEISSQQVQECPNGSGT